MCGGGGVSAEQPREERGWCAQKEPCTWAREGRGSSGDAVASRRSHSDPGPLPCALGRRWCSQCTRRGRSPGAGSRRGCWPSATVSDGHLATIARAPADAPLLQAPRSHSPCIAPTAELAATSVANCCVGVVEPHPLWRLAATKRAPEWAHVSVARRARHPGRQERLLRRQGAGAARLLQQPAQQAPEPPAPRRGGDGDEGARPHDVRAGFPALRPRAQCAARGWFTRGWAAESGPARRLAFTLPLILPLDRRRRSKRRTTRPTWSTTCRQSRCSTRTRRAPPGSRPTRSRTWAASKRTAAKRCALAAGTRRKGRVCVGEALAQRSGPLLWLAAAAL